MTATDNIEDRVCTVVTSHLGCADCFSWDRSLADLGADTLDKVELSMALEDEFGISIPEGDEFAWSKPSDLLETVKGLV